MTHPGAPKTSDAASTDGMDVMNRWMPLALIALAVTLGGCAKRVPKGQQNATNPSLSPLEKVRIDLFQGRAEEALQAVNRILASQPDQPEVLLERGRCQMALGKPKLAMSDLDRCLILRPQWTEALYERGILSGRIGEREKSKSDLKQALTQDVGLELYLNWRSLDANLESRLRSDPSPWFKEFEMLADAEPNNPTIYVLRGLCFLAAGEGALNRSAFVRAEDDFTRAINLFKANPMLAQPYDAWANRAFVRAFQGKDKEAEEDKAEAFKRLPTPDHGREVNDRVAMAKARARELR